MSWKPVWKLEGIAGAWYDPVLYKENVDDYAFHGAHSATNVIKVEGTVTGELPIRKDPLSFYLRDTFGNIACSSPIPDLAGRRVH